jgi:hypothetical protein
VHDATLREAVRIVDIAETCIDDGYCAVNCRIAVWVRRALGISVSLPKLGRPFIAKQNSLLLLSGCGILPGNMVLFLISGGKDEKIFSGGSVHRHALDPGAGVNV